MIYICPKCRRNEQVKERAIIHCDNCSIIMIEERILDITGKDRNKKIPKFERDIVSSIVAESMEKIFGHREWMDYIRDINIIRRISSSRKEEIFKYSEKLDTKSPMKLKRRRIKDVKN